MTADELVLFHKCTGRVSPPPTGAKEVYTVVGRRGGKSFISAIVGVFVACLCSFKEYLTTGERGMVLILAVDKAQAKVVFNYCRGIINHILCCVRWSPHGAPMRLNSATTYHRGQNK